MHQQEQWLKMPGGALRFARAWWPETLPQAIMCVVPGLGDHSGRYAALAEELAPYGIATLSMDFQGHGLSPGWRGCIDSYESLFQDVGNLVQLARGGDALYRHATAEPHQQPQDQPIDIQRWPSNSKIPVCLYGHSMGGNLVLNAVMRNTAKPDRAIASAPMLRAVHPPGPTFMRIARMLQVIAPHWRLKAPVRKELLSHLNSEQESYQRDRLMHRSVSLRLGAGLIDSGLWILRNAALLNTPCLVLHGTEDQITDPKASQEFVSSVIACSGPAQLITYMGMLHDLHRDQGKQRVIRDIAQWVTAAPD